jgi:type IV pilus assembly protein PilF
MLWLLLTGCITHQEILRADSQVILGTAYYREGQVELSIQTLENAVKLDPRNWRARSNLAIAYVARGQPEKAERSFHRALRLAPDEAEVLNNYGTFLLSQGRAEEATKVFEHALADLDYRSPALVLSNLSASLLIEGRTEEGLRAAEEAVRRAPSLCDGYHQLARIQEARNDVPGALNAYARLLQECPQEATDARLKAGCLQVKAGNVSLGTTLLEELVLETEGTEVADKARACMES